MTNYTPYETTRAHKLEIEVQFLIAKLLLLSLDYDKFHDSTIDSLDKKYDELTSEFLIMRTKG